VWDSGVSPPELMEFLDNHQPGRALDMGAGTGTNMLSLFQNGWEVIGVEYALRAVMIGRKKLRDNGFPPTLFLKNVTNPLSIEGKFNLIYDIGCFHSLSGEGKEAYKQNLLQYLHIGGSFLIYGFMESRIRRNGISKNDINNLKENFLLEKQKEGIDRNVRPSIWMQFKREN